jgi:hypothetical protein
VFATHNKVITPVFGAIGLYIVQQKNQNSAVKKIKRNAADYEIYELKFLITDYNFLL